MPSIAPGVVFRESLYLFHSSRLASHEHEPGTKGDEYKHYKPPFTDVIWRKALMFHDLQFWFLVLLVSILFLSQVQDKGIHCGLGNSRSHED